MLLEVREAKKKQFKIDKNTDLCDQVELSVADMNKIIDGWDSVVKNGTAFKGRGAAFIEAARETGLNPVYILAHAAYESAWGKSAIAKEKANFFGINATDTETYNNAYEMGYSIDKGIIEGAKWVKQNYYDEGQTSLYSMIHGGKTYASAQDRWVSNIVSIVNTSYKML
jgi:beta-N-acetylglucosaminidase